MDYKIIISPQQSRKLLHMNNPIYDIKPNKKEGHENETVFVFEMTEKFKIDLTSISK